MQLCSPVRLATYNMVYGALRHNTDRFFGRGQPERRGVLARHSRELVDCRSHENCLGIGHATSFARLDEQAISQSPPGARWSDLAESPPHSMPVVHCRLRVRAQKRLSQSACCGGRVAGEGRTGGSWGGSPRLCWPWGETGEPVPRRGLRRYWSLPPFWCCCYQPFIALMLLHLLRWATSERWRHRGGETLALRCPTDWSKAAALSCWGTRALSMPTRRKHWQQRRPRRLP